MCLSVGSIGSGRLQIGSDVFVGTHVTPIPVETPLETFTHVANCHSKRFGLVFKDFLVFSGPRCAKSGKSTQNPSEFYIHLKAMVKYPHDIET